MVSTISIVVAIMLVNFSCCLCVVHVGNNTSTKYNSAYGLATSYGSETGAGSGAACGWNDDVKYPPFAAMISAGNANIFLKGKGCGHCFAISCNTPPYCSGKPVWVTITDECPGLCNKVPFHFDLSGTAFGAMALPGQEHNLRQLGQVDVQFKRVPCNHGNAKIAFTVSDKSNPYWFAVALEYANGDGGFRSVEIAPGGAQNFGYMTNIWGAVWQININPSFKGPFSFRLTSADGKVVVAWNVIPQGFTNGHKYWSNVNF